MNLFQTSVVFAILCFAVEIIANLKSDIKLIKWLPMIILTVVSVCNLIYWIAGLGTYDYNDILSRKEADALSQAIILGAGMAGCVLAGIMHLVLERRNDK